MDTQSAFPDNPKAMGRGDNEYVYKRSAVALAAAARALDIEVDVDALAPTLRRGDDGMLIPSDELFAMAREIFRDPRETLGIDMAQMLPLEQTGLWGFLLRSSDTFGDMLRRAERYMRVVNRESEFLLENRGDDVAMVCPHPDPSMYGPREQVVCLFLGHWISWGRRLTGVSFAVEETRFRWLGPKDRTPFQRFFGGRIEFSANEDALILRSDVLNLPLPEQAPEAAAQFEDYAASLIRRMTPRASLAERVRDAIAEGMLTGSVREVAVAQRLAMTVRTMHRHLGDAETSFRGIRDQLLRERSEALLLERRVPISEVSYLLGYAEPSNFHRAFRRWTGSTPAQWREHMHRRDLQAGT